MEAANLILRVNPEGIPKDMKSFKHWVVWDAVERENGKIDKIPHDPRSGYRASTKDSRTWAMFPEALDAYDSAGTDWAGIGFVISSGDPFVALDFDACRVPETGVVSEEVRAFIDSFVHKYVEVSPSGTGLHLITRGSFKEGSRRGHLEMYGQDRFLTITGVSPDA